MDRVWPNFCHRQVLHDSISAKVIEVSWYNGETICMANGLGFKCNHFLRNNGAP
jgi:hypothetical protein